MSKKNEEQLEQEIIDEEIFEPEEEFEIVEKESFISKTKNFAKKHGKKIAIGGAIGLGALAGFLLGRNTGDFDDLDDCDEEDLLQNIIDVECSETDSESN